MQKKEYRRDERIIDVYFQKSYKFLFPLLKIKTDNYRPAQVFVAWLDNIKTDDYKLIVVYDLREDNEYKKFENRELFNNPHYEDFRVLEGNKGAYIFNMNSFKVDVDHFYNGQYSLFSKQSKDRLLTYYSPNPHNREYIESYLNPENYFKLYSELLDLPVDVVRTSGELCNKYDKNRERLTLNEVVYNFQNSTEV